jgi:transcriptional regulator
MAYPVPTYHVTDPDKILDVIQTFPLASLVTSRGNDISVSYIPLIFEDTTEGRFLLGHLDRNNPQLNDLNEAPVLALFHGPDAPISPNDYATEQLPTWNFLKVEVRGTATLIQDPEELKRSLMTLNTFLERDQETPFVLGHDHPRMNALLSYIQGFKIRIEDWHATFKLSQEKVIEDYEGARKKLRDHTITRIYEVTNKWM